MSTLTPYKSSLPLQRNGFPRVMHAEWTKFRSVRSTAWSLGVAVLLTLLIPLIASLATRQHWADMSADERASTHPLDIALPGVYAAQLAIAVLGVLMISAEETTH